MSEVNPSLHPQQSTIDAPDHEDIVRGHRLRIYAYETLISVVICGVLLWQTLPLILPHNTKLCHTSVVVDKSGGANFTTISAAIDDVPTNSHRYCIYIKAGVYNESLEIPPDTHNIMLVGSGVDKTIIVSDSINNHNSTLVNWGDGLIARDLTLRRLKSGTTLNNMGDFSIFYRCNIEGNYDGAINSFNGKQFYRECEIKGSNSYLIYGDGKAIFQRCNITATVPRNEFLKAMIANSRKSIHVHTGFVFHLCQFSAETPTFLIIPTSEYWTVIVMQSFINDDSSIQGWILDLMYTNLSGVYFAEFQNNGLRPYSSMLHNIHDIADASEFTVRVFLQGETWLPQTSLPFELDILNNYPPS